MSRNLRRWSALGALLLAGLTLVVPIEAWHHHDAPHDAGHCEICAIAAHIIATPSTPSTMPVLAPAVAIYSGSAEQRVPLSAAQLLAGARAPPQNLLSA